MDAAHDDEEVACGQAAHEDARQALDWAEYPLWFRHRHVAVAKGGVGGSGKVERRFGIGQASAPQIEQAPRLKSLPDGAGPATRSCAAASG